MSNTPSEAELARQASFIFKGTVLKLKASNVAQVEARDKDKTIIARVDEIVQAPDAFADFINQEVTVKLREGQNLKVGDHAVFYTNGWIRAENLAVEEVGHRAIEGAGTTSDDEAGHSSARELRKRLASAEAVVTGRVVNVRVPEDAEPRLVGSANLEKPARFLPASEPESKWREAVVHVTEVLKGAHDQQEIVVRFPASKDALGDQATEFQVGQEGVFILHKTLKTGETSEERPPATAKDEEALTTSNAYTALHPKDFQPLDQLEEIRKLVKADKG